MNRLKHNAELIWSLLRERIIDESQAVAWADNIILGMDEPPYWLFELSLGGDRFDLMEILRKAPGEYSERTIAEGLYSIFARRLAAQPDEWRKIANILFSIALDRGDYEGPMGHWMTLQWEAEEAEDHNPGRLPRVRDAVVGHLAPFIDHPLPDLGPLTRELLPSQR